MAAVTTLEFGSNLRPSVVSLIKKLNEIVTAVNALEAADNTSDIKALQTRCTNLETQATTLSGNITTITNTNTTQQTDIDNIKTTLYTPLAANESVS